MTSIDGLQSSYAAEKVLRNTGSISLPMNVFIDICPGLAKPSHDNTTFLQGSTGHELSPVKQADWGPHVKGPISSGYQPTMDKLRC